MFRAICFAIPIAHASLVTPTRNDPCATLCREFSANNRGNGFDLCDPSVRSRCVDGLCTHLYWSESDDGASGLVYGLTEADLEPDDLAVPLTCSGAIGVIGRDADLNFWNIGLFAFIHLPPVHGWLANPPSVFDHHQFFAALESLRQSDGSFNITDTSYIREYLSAVGDNIFSYDQDPETVFQILAGNIMNALPPRERFWHHVCLWSERICTNCGQDNFRGVDGPSISIPVLVNAENNTFDFETAFTSFASENTEVLCPGCHGLHEHECDRRISNAKEIVMIKLERNETLGDIEVRIPDRVTFPHRADDPDDVARETIGDVELDLVGIIHQNHLFRSYFVDVKVDGQWFRYDGEVLQPLEQLDELSSSASTLLFKTVNRSSTV